MSIDSLETEPNTELIHERLIRLAPQPAVRRAAHPFEAEEEEEEKKIFIHSREPAAAPAPSTPQSELFEDDHGISAIFLASAKGFTPVVELLAKHTKEIDLRTSKGRTALMYACYEGHLETAKVLVENGASTSAEDNDGNSVLYYALQNGNSELLNYLAPVTIEN